MTTDATLSSAAPGADYAAAATEAYQAALRVIESVEPRIAAATRKELTDQRESLKLIASENYASPAVLLTMGTSYINDCIAFKANRRASGASSFIANKDSHYDQTRADRYRHPQALRAP